MIGPPRCPAAAARGGDGQRIRRGYGPSTSPPPRRPARRRRAIRTNTYPGESCLNLHGTLFWLMGSRLCEQRALPLSADLLARNRGLEGKGNPYATTSANGGILVHVVGRGGGGAGDEATVPAQACAWALVTTRRRSPKRHRQSPRSQPGLAPGRRIPPGDGPRRDTVLTFAWDYPWPCFLERETRWGVFRRSRDRLGTCPPARPLVALGAFTPSPGLRSKNLTWGLAVPMPAVEELVRRCRAPRAAGSLLPIRP